MTPQPEPAPAGIRLADRTHRTLIVARMDPADERVVTEIFSESDAGDLPRLVGVRRRDLFSFRGLYFHLIDSSGEIGGRLGAVRENPLFTDVNARLAGHIGAYDPASWRSPADAMARHFYSWSAD